MLHLKEYNIKELMDGSSNKRTTKADGGTVCKQILINTKLRTRKRGHKTELTGKVH
jgi:hypothetical protein